MLGNVFLKSLRDQRRALIGWGIGVAALVGIMAAVWPSMRTIPNLDELLAGYPDAMKELFNIESITTGAGYLNAELFSLMLPAMFLVFAIGRGARMIAGEEEAGTLETLLVTPVSRTRLLLDQAAALGVANLALGVVLFVTTALSAAVLDMGVPVAETAAATFAMVLLGVEHGWLALAVGAASGRRSIAIAVASTVATAGYVLYVLGSLVDVFEPWQSLSPIHQAVEAGPLGGGLQPSFLWLAAAAVVFVVGALPLFDRRDVRTP